VKTRANGIDIRYEISGASHLSSIEQAETFNKLLLEYPTE